MNDKELFAQYVHDWSLGNLEIDEPFPPQLLDISSRVSNGQSPVGDDLKLYFKYLFKFIGKRVDGFTEDRRNHAYPKLANMLANNLAKQNKHMLNMIFEALRNDTHIGSKMIAELNKIGYVG